MPFLERARYPNATINTRTGSAAAHAVGSVEQNAGSIPRKGELRNAVKPQTQNDSFVPSQPLLFESKSFD